MRLLVWVINSIFLHYFFVILINALPWTVTLMLRHEGIRGEPNTSASGRLTSENVSATTSATSTIEESNIVEVERR